MATPYPPILDTQRPSMAQQTASAAFRITFTRPRNLAGAAFNIGHIQVLIRRQLTLESWATPGDTSPDREIIYLPPSAISWIDPPANTAGDIVVPAAALRLFTAGDMGGLSTGQFNSNFRGAFTANPTPRYEINSTVTFNGDLWRLVVPVPTGAFPSPTVNPALWQRIDNEGQMYTIQVRFGSGPLPPIGGFAAWQNDQVANRNFGEWSNTQRMFVFAGSRATIFPRPQIETDSFLVAFTWRYAPVSDDPLVQARLTYWYNLPDGPHAGDERNPLVFRRISMNVPFESQIAHEEGAISRWGASGRVELDLARLTNVRFLLTLTTANNSIFNLAGTGTAIMDIPPMWTTAPTAQGSTSIEPLIGEEIEDGAIAVRVTAETSGRIPVFRVNTYTLEAVLLNPLDPGDIQNATNILLKDYTVEMGAEYAYVGVRSAAMVFSDISPLIAGTWAPQRYSGMARNMNFNANSFLTTRNQQLRLTGNVQVRNFNRVTSDQITQTIGGKYPFYSRAGAMNYRTLALSAVVSLRLDPTRTFFQLSPPENGWWDSDLVFNQELRLRRTDLFGETATSFNTRRTREPGTPESNFVEDMSANDRILGAAGIYNVRGGRNTTELIDEDPSIQIYAERKFRESVMAWLVDGQPKLFRSETEGNMIVMLTGVSFAPLRTDRRLYTLSATLTEIAEYTLRNLVLYNLIPASFMADTPDMPIGHLPGNLDVGLFASPTIIQDRRTRPAPPSPPFNDVTWLTIRIRNPFTVAVTCNLNVSNSNWIANTADNPNANRNIPAISASNQNPSITYRVRPNPVLGIGTHTTEFRGTIAGVPITIPLIVTVEEAA